MVTFNITRRIEIDAAHRVPDHASKCRRLHGHRYVIEATCSGALQAEGASAGMIVDFGFLKEDMMTHIHDPCDHALILFSDDGLLEHLYGTKIARDAEDACAIVGAYRHESVEHKLYAINATPTAENLAAHWFHLLSPVIATRGPASVALTKIVVWETPNCSAQYPG